MTRRMTTAAVALCCVAGAAPSVVAQAPAGGRPSRGLFGSAPEGRAGGQSLEVTATLVQAYDDNLLAESGSIVPGSTSVGGHFTMLQAGSEYEWANRSVQVGFTHESAFRYLGRQGEVQSTSHAGGLGLSATLPHRTTFLVNQSAAYSPSYLFGLFPEVGEAVAGEPVPIAPDYALDDRASYSYATTASLSHGLNSRSSLTASADYTFTDFVTEASGLRDMAATGIRAGLSHRTGRRTSLRTGYRYRTGEIGVATRDSATEHGVDVGVDHTRVLSASRQAHFGVAFGLSATDAPLEGTVAARNRLYRLIGDATIGYQFGRSWQGRAAYRRGLEYIAELSEPVLVGGFTAAVDGLLTRRVDLAVTAAYSSGESALQTAAPFDSYTANVSSRFAVTRSVAVHIEYLYYFYDFGESSLLRPGLPPRLERNGVRAGLTLWAPIIRR